MDKSHPTIARFGVGMKGYSQWYTLSLACVQERKHGSYSKNISSQIHFPRSGVYDTEGKYSIQHFGGDFCSKTSVEMKNDLAIAVCLVLEVVLATQVTAVVNFAVVEQPKMRICRHRHRLHPKRRVDDCQPVEAKARARKGGNGLHAEGIRSPMGHFHALDA